MSPILVRPVREQFEHDRVIRVLQARYKKKFDVAINPGAEQNASVVVGELTLYPDLVLFGQDRARKVVGTVEVETTESINTLEAMAEWAQFSRLPVAFHLYVPPNTVDTVKRMCIEHQVKVAEIWTYHTAVDQVRFTMVHRAPDAPVAKTRAPRASEKFDTLAKDSKPAKPGTKAAPARPARPVKFASSTTTVTPAKTPKTAKPAKPAKKAAPVKKASKPGAAKKPAAKKAAKPAKRR